MSVLNKITVGSTEYDIEDATAAKASSLASVATSGSYDDLDDKPTIPAAQIQADWNQSDNTAKDFIKSKPTLGTAAAKDSTNEVTTGSTALVESGAVYDALNNKTYTEVYCSTGNASNLVKNTNLTNPRQSNVESISGSSMVTVTDAQIVYKEVLKTIWQAKNGKTFNFGSANISSDYGGTVVFYLNGIVGYTNAVTFSDDSDNPTTDPLVSQSIMIYFSTTSVSLRIVETKEGRLENIYIWASYNSVNDSISLSIDGATNYPCIGLLVEN